MYRLKEYLSTALERAATIITAHSRQAFAIRSAWGEQQRQLGRTAWPTPDVLPLSAWLARHWSRALDGDTGADFPVLLDSIQERMLWEQVVTASAREQRLLHPHGAASAAWRTWQRVHDWAIDLRSLEDVHSEETRVFLGWSEHAVSEMRERDWMDAPRALWRCPIGPLVEDAQHFAIVGFDEDSPARQALQRRFAERNVQVLEAPARAPLGRPAKVACADPDAELEAAARWARNRLERNPADRLLIAIADLERRRELVERTFSEVLEPNALLVSAPRGGSTFALEESVSLDRYPLVATALTALELAAERVPFDTASQWLRSPYWLSGTSRAASRAQLDALLRRVSAPELDLSSLLDALAHRSLCAEESMSVALRRFAEELRKGRLAPADWSATFSRALNVIGWPGDRPLDSAEFQTVDKFHEALRTLATLDRLLGRVDLASAVRTLRHLVEQIAFQPESGDTPVRITSRIGDPVVTYDGIWVSGLHAGAWPESPRPDPFIPWRVQATVGLPGATARGVLQRARHTLSNWVAGATEVIVSWPVRLNEESCDPSPLIAAFPDFAWPDEKRPRYSELIHEAARRERLVDENAPPLIPGAKVRGGARALRLQSQCPFRATAEQRFGAQPLEQPEPGIDARTRGQLVHRALEQIWSTLGGLDGLLGRSVEERAMTVNAAADAASRGVLERGRRFSAAVRAIEAERLRELLRQWLALETGRGPFRVIGIEQVFDCSIAGLAFRLRVDRIDQLADGRQVLIDYKSGEADTKDWLGERPDDPQLPLYAQVLEEAPGALAYAMLSTDGCRFAGVSSVPPAIGGLAPERDWPTLLAQWRSTIERLASEVVAGRAAVDPLRTACSTCHLHALCRIDEVRRRSSQESPSE